MVGLRRRVSPRFSDKLHELCTLHGAASLPLCKVHRYAWGPLGNLHKNL